jgi:hypothetical protein
MDAGWMPTLLYLVEEPLDQVTGAKVAAKANWLRPVSLPSDFGNWTQYLPGNPGFM